MPPLVVILVVILAPSEEVGRENVWPLVTQIQQHVVVVVVVYVVWIEFDLGLDRRDDKQHALFPAVRTVFLVS